MTDITKHLIKSDTDHMELENFLSSLESSQREPRHVLKSSTTFYGANIRATSNGKGRFTKLEWLGADDETLNQFLIEANEALFGNVEQKVSTNIIFFKYPVETIFRVEKYCQIIPVPASWPRSTWWGAPHPAIIEFSYIGSSNKNVDRFRRSRIHHNLINFFFVTLKCSMREVHFNKSAWVVDSEDPGEKIRCLKTGYFGGSDHWLEKDVYGFSIPEALQCPVVPTEEYYQRDPSLDLSFEVPESLTYQLGCFLALPPDKQGSFMRAAHWVRTSIATLPISLTAALTGLFSAFDALIGPLPPPSTVEKCKCCGRGQQTSASKRFENFLNDYVDLDTLKNRKEILELYSSTRNGYVHGGKISAFEDAPYDSGFSERRDRDSKIYHHVRHMFQIACINWLIASCEAAH